MTKSKEKKQKFTSKAKLEINQPEVIINPVQKVINDLQVLCDNNDSLVVGKLIDTSTPEVQLAQEVVENHAKNWDPKDSVSNLVSSALTSGSFDLINKIYANRKYMNEVEEVILLYFGRLSHHGIFSEEKIKQIFPWLEFGEKVKQRHIEYTAFFSASLGLVDQTVTLISEIGDDDNCYRKKNISSILVDNLVDQGRILEAECFIRDYTAEYYKDKVPFFENAKVATGYALHGDLVRSEAMFRNLFEKCDVRHEWDRIGLFKYMVEAGMDGLAIELYYKFKGKNRSDKPDNEIPTPRFSNQNPNSTFCRLLASEMLYVKKQTKPGDIDQVCMMGMFDIALRMLGQCELSDYYSGVQNIFERLVQFDHVEEALKLIEDATLSLPDTQKDKLELELAQTLVIAYVKAGPENIDMINHFRKLEPVNEALSIYARRYGVRVKDLMLNDTKLSAYDQSQLIDALIAHSLNQ